MEATLYLLPYESAGVAGGFGLVNPLDLLSPTTANDSLDGLSVGQNAIDIIRMTTLHELGHVVGMGPGDTEGRLRVNRLSE
ncbi:MAG: hypothetical protein WBW88_08410 [Rhodothermales bacterium]